MSLFGLNVKILFFWIFWDIKNSKNFQSIVYIFLIIVLFPICRHFVN